MAIVRSLGGDIPAATLGPTLIHEHLVVDLRIPSARPADYADDVETIVGPMIEHLRAVYNQGIRAIVDCTPSDLGQHRTAYRAVAARTGLHVIAAVGTYRDAWLPEWVTQADRARLAHWYEAGIRDGAGFIKLGCNPDGPTAAEARCVEAAGLASRRTNALVACHVGYAAPATRILDHFEAAGGDPARFVVVHLQNEPDVATHLDLAARGAWVEYDTIGVRPSDDVYIELLQALADAGRLDQALISQDACAYMVHNDGRIERQHRFDYLMGAFVPRLRVAGFDNSDIDRLLIHNPARALAMPGGA